MARIIARNKQYCGISASVPFVNGVGETSTPHLIDWFKEHGYKVVEDKEIQGNDEISGMGQDQEGESLQVKLGYLPEDPGRAPSETNEPDNLETLTKKELMQIADGLHIEYTARETNENLVQMIRLAKPVVEEE